MTALFNINIRKGGRTNKRTNGVDNGGRKYNKAQVGTLGETLTFTAL